MAHGAYRLRASTDGGPRRAGAGAAALGGAALLPAGVTASLVHALAARPAQTTMTAMIRSFMDGPPAPRRMVPRVQHQVA